MDRCDMKFETLVDYREGRLDAAQAEQVRAHLDIGCEQCRQQLARMERSLSALREVDRFHAPQAAVERARALFRERFRKPERPPLLARLVFDSRTQPAFAAARGVGSAAIQTLFATETHEIDLWQEQTEGTLWYLIGQVLPREGEEAVAPESAVFTDAEGNRLEARLEGDEFHAPELPAGVYQLDLRLGETEIVLPEVVVGA